ncbi:MAG: hypothetical protein F4047_13270 [Caldilineaceae bacterium SB0670_bin_27]|nr:hypothetical protein [Caldilineaceae bacterium SB0670_bin_27]
MACPDVEAAVLVEIDEQEGEGLGIGGEVGGYEVFAAVLVVDDAAVGEVVRIDAGVFGLVGGEDEVEVDVAVEIRPRECVGVGGV